MGTADMCGCLLRHGRLQRLHFVLAALRRWRWKHANEKKVMHLLQRQAMIPGLANTYLVITKMQHFAKSGWSIQYSGQPPPRALSSSQSNLCSATHNPDYFAATISKQWWSLTSSTGTLLLHCNDGEQMQFLGTPFTTAATARLDRQKLPRNCLARYPLISY